MECHGIDDAKLFPAEANATRARGLEERSYIVTVIVVLMFEFERKQKKKLIQFANAEHAKGGKQKLHTRDVNKLVGWAIFKLRLGRIHALNELVEDGTEKEIRLQKRNQFF